MIMKGQKINDRYQIIKTIGEGGMANVYLAYDVILDRNVAVKILRGDLATDEKFVCRFQREALSASSLTHPNIVEVYDVGEDNGLYYIVMEYIEGRHLKQLLKKRGKLTITEAVDIMMQLTDGMSVAHDHYIIHRDIKPQNIMILENGMVKITDFGIAMALNSTQLTQTNSVMGSVHYLPPEQANGKGSTIQSDIYSMGILFFELLTGTLPYRGDNAVEIALKHLKEKIPSVRNIDDAIPQSVENIIIKSTSKNIKNRYADAREMYEDLKTCLSDARKMEEKYALPYPDLDDVDEKRLKKLTPEVSESENENNEIKVEKISEKEIKKKENKLLLILGVVFTSLVIITTAIIFLLPKLTENADVLVPDVSGLSVIDAEKKLQSEGFEVQTETKLTTSDTIKEGLIVKTSPAAGRTVKEGTIIVLYESSGVGGYTMEDLTGKNYLEIKGVLQEMYNLYVVTETIEVDDISTVEEGEIISFEPAIDTVLKEGDTVTLYIPDMTAEYPDFTTNAYSLKDIEAFAAKYELELSVTYEPTEEYEPGAIISQNREAGTKVINGMTLKIVIAEELEAEVSAEEIVE